MTNRMKSAIYVNGHKIEMDYPQFNGGERNIRLPDEVMSVSFSSNPSDYVFNVHALLFDSNSVMDLLLVCDAVKRISRFSAIGTLTVPYVPYSRQDRVCNKGEAFGLKVFCDLINSIGAHLVVIYDPYSDVTPALINNVEVWSQDKIVAEILYQNEDIHTIEKSSYTLPIEFVKYCKDVVVISPDGGAIKKAKNIAKSAVNARLEIAGKIRDVTDGSITGIFFNPSKSIDAKNCLIPDDISDKGMSFYYLSNHIRDKHNPDNIGLLITHGLFVDGVEKLYESIDDIFTINYTVPNELRIIRL